jgi:DNA-binding CsgD family transcriptional regulator
VQHIGRLLASIEAGWLEEAAELAAASAASMIERNQREGQATFAMFTGMVAVARGDLVQAGRAFREGAAVNRELSDDLGVRWCVAGTAMAAAMMADVTSVEDATAELDAMPPVSAQLLGIELLGRGQAWVAVARGEMSAARTRLLELAEYALAHDQVAATVACLHDAARLGDRSVGDRLGTLATQVDGPLAGARARHATGLAGDDPRLVEGAGETFEGLGALLLGAEAFTEAARLYRSAGLLRAATVSERRAGALLERCPGASTPVIAEAVLSSAALTAREREIAGLAAAGLSSKDIAARLVVSARTVDNHLQRVYTKLGISGRDQLASVLARTPP